MRRLCIYFQVHQPFRLRKYRFFDIGRDHYYYDDFSNENILRKIADKCYLPANEVLYKLAKEYGKQFKIAFSISGIALDQFELYAPEVLDSFKKLASTGCVEFLSETYSHSLVSLTSKEEFINEVKAHDEKIKKYFGQSPKVFRNTELIYSDEIGELVANMGFKAILTEGAKRILGWKSPNYIYCNANNPRLKVLLRNHQLSDDIAFRFSDKNWSEHPLTADKFALWLNAVDKKEETVNLFMDYETFGEHQSKETGILDFLHALPKAVFSKTNFQFMTPSEVADSLQPVAPVSVTHPISWADTERDLTAWQGNFLQEEAFNKLYILSDRIHKSKDPDLLTDWKYLQSSDHFYYMCTKFFSDGAVHTYFNPYASPYEAFINYMNILTDFTIRLDEQVPVKETVKGLKEILLEKEEHIKKLKSEIISFQDKIEETEIKLLTKKSEAQKIPTFEKKSIIIKNPVKSKKTNVKTEIKKPVIKKTKKTTKVAPKITTKVKKKEVKKPIKKVAKTIKKTKTVPKKAVKSNSVKKISKKPVKKVVNAKKKQVKVTKKKVVTKAKSKKK